MGDPSHRQPAEAIRAAHAHCRQQGVRLTPLREAVLRLVLEDGKPVKAYDLLERLRQGHARAAAPTVYRALDFLIGQGFIHRLESINAFVGCGHPSDPHDSQFLICDACESTLELDDPAIAGRLKKAARSQGFEPHHQTIEIHGLCEACSEADAEA